MDGSCAAGWCDRCAAGWERGGRLLLCLQEEGCAAGWLCCWVGEVDDCCCAAIVGKEPDS